MNDIISDKLSTFSLHVSDWILNISLTYITYLLTYMTYFPSAVWAGLSRYNINNIALVIVCIVVVVCIRTGHQNYCEMPSHCSTSACHKFATGVGQIDIYHLPVDRAKVPLDISVWTASFRHSSTVFTGDEISFQIGKVWISAGAGMTFSVGKLAAPQNGFAQLKIGMPNEGIF